MTQKASRPAKKDADILWYREIDKNDLGLVGGKGANLGEMFSVGLPVPDGFVVTSGAYYRFLDENDLRPKITAILKVVNKNDPQSINEASEAIQKLIRAKPLPPQLARQIIAAYLKLGGPLRQALVAIRSSATAEDLPGASFAGQQETYLNVQGEARVLDRVRDCWASLFEPRAIFYREEKGFEHMKVGMAVPVQQMIPSDVSGVMFTIDPVSADKKTIIIEAVWGLGEYIVQGKVTPDRYLVAKKSYDITKIDIAKQTVQLVKARRENKETTVPVKKQTKRKLSDRQIVALAKLGQKIQDHYFFPQDIEWSLYKNKLWILQTRPVTTLESDRKKSPPAAAPETRKPLLEGSGASPGLADGEVKIINDPKKIKDLKQGEILVTRMTTPDFVPAMRRAAAIVTDSGGQTSHAAIVSRELGTPCVVGTETATKILKNKQMITVNGTSGKIYAGPLKTASSRKFSPADSGLTVSRDRLDLIRTATKIYVNLAEPELAAEVASRPVDGVGLLRAEFMLANLGRHPKKVIKERRQAGYISRLAEDMASFAAAFSPRPVVYRATDFKTNEYRHLVGGAAFEPHEENPMLGYRGAFRYLSDPQVFHLELEAIKRVRNKLGYKNLWLMIPFCRTPQELREVKKLLAAAGLMRTPSFKLWLMVEIPANVIRLEEFIEVGIDGVSIGSNDLTMLTLGVDRDNAELAASFREDDPAVLWALEKTVRACKKAGITCSICGQAATTVPAIVEKLVGWGISSVSVTPDAIGRTRELVYLTEKKVK